MSFTKMFVNFSNDDGHTLEIEYQIRNTEAAQLWASSIDLAKSSGLRETQRFYNFPNHECLQVENLYNQLDEIILSLQRIHPQLNLPMLDRSDVSNSLNGLHFNFAHGHHVTHLITKENSQLWNDFNVVLHAIEGGIPNNRALEKTELNLARVVFTWHNSFSKEIPDPSYQDFFLGYEFGVAYANYAQVGRHFYEMFSTNDDQLADEHIRPARFISADTNLWFGPTTGHVFAKNTKDQVSSWFEKRKERFNKLGHYWGDPKLALGNIPVGRLKEPLFTTNEINSFVSELSKYTIVSRVRVE